MLKSRFFHTWLLAGFLLGISFSAHAGPRVDRLHLQFVASPERSSVEGIRINAYGQAQGTSFFFGCSFSSGVPVGNPALLCRTTHSSASEVLESNSKGEIVIENRKFGPRANREAQLVIEFSGPPPYPNCGINHFQSQITGEWITDSFLRLNQAQLNELRGQTIVCIL